VRWETADSSSASWWRPHVSVKQDELNLSRDLVERYGLEQLCWGLFNTSGFLYVD
jgi:hypothetical protein